MHQLKKSVIFILLCVIVVSSSFKVRSRDRQKSISINGLKGQTGENLYDSNEKNNEDDDATDEESDLTNDESEESTLREKRHFSFEKIRKTHYTPKYSKIKERLRQENQKERLTWTNLFESRKGNELEEKQTQTPVDTQQQQQQPQQQTEQTIKPVTSKRKSKSVKEFVNGLLEWWPLKSMIELMKEKPEESVDDKKSLDDDKPLGATEILKEDLMNRVRNRVADRTRAKRKDDRPKSAIYEYEKSILQLPSFYPNFSRTQNLECRAQGEILSRDLRYHELYALKIADSSAKMSHLLRGAIIQLGDFDNCVSVSNVEVEFMGQESTLSGRYCLATIQINRAHQGDSDNVNQLLQMIHANSAIKRSSLNDSSHFYSVFNEAIWGSCIPNACTSDDAAKFLSGILKVYNSSSGLEFKVDVSPDDCFTKNRHWKQIIEDLLSWKIYGTMGFFSFFLAAVLVSSLNDYAKELHLDYYIARLTKSRSEILRSMKENDEKISQNEMHEGIFYQTLMSFSLRRNLPALFKVSSSDFEDIQCIHGIKAISTLLIFLSAKFNQLAILPFSNRSDLSEVSNFRLSVFLRAFPLIADAFLLVSAFLAANSVIRDLKTKRTIGFFRRIISRYIRLLPGLLALVLFYSFIWEHIGAGPMWGRLVVKNANLCKLYWWRNIVFAQNFWPFEEMCATHSFHLALDMQIYILIPIVVWILLKIPSLGFLIVGILLALSSGGRFIAVQDNRFSLVVYHGTGLSELYNLSNKLMNNSFLRCTPSLIGVLTAMFINEANLETKLPKVVVSLGWTASFWALSWVFSPVLHLSQRNFIFEPNETAEYAAMAPLIFSLCLGWIIFACYHGYGNVINQILGTKLFRFLSQISYPIYLVQFSVLFHSAASKRHAEKFSLFSFLDLREVFILFAVAILLSLTIDMPCKKIRKIIMDGLEETVEAKGEIVLVEEDLKTCEPNVAFEESKTDEEQSSDPWEQIREVNESDDEEIYIPSFRKEFQFETKRMSPREYFKSDSPSGFEPEAETDEDEELSSYWKKRLSELQAAEEKEKNEFELEEEFSESEIESEPGEFEPESDEAEYENYENDNDLPLSNTDSDVEM